MDPRSAKTRLALLDAAEELFAERGFAGVGNRELVARAEVNLAAIKYHFGSKRGLYLETVRRAVQRPEIQASWEALPCQPVARAEAGRALVAFLRELTARLLSDREVGACTKLMLREAMQPSGALRDVVDTFVRPHEEKLVGTIRALAPDLELHEAQLAARSVLGQVLHQHLFAPFFETQRNSPDDEALVVETVAEHIARFSMRGLGCKEYLIERSVRTEMTTRKEDA